MAGENVQTAGRVPPHHLEAERSVLGAILLSNPSFYAAVECGLEARDFYRDAHQKIFEAIQSLMERSEVVDLVTLTASLKDRGVYDAIGGSATLTALFDNSFQVPNVAYYAKIIRDKALQRRIIEVAADIATSAYDGVEDTESFLNEAESKIFSVSDAKTTSSLTPMNEILKDGIREIEELSLRKEDIAGLPTGFTDFDHLTTGLKGGQLIILAARPAMGKTSLFLSMAQNAAKDGKKVIAIFSLEMSKNELLYRMLAGLSRIDSKRIKIGRLRDNDWPRLLQSSDLLSKSKVFIDDSGELTVMDVRARCRRLYAKEKRIDLIVIDYLQLMKGSRAASKEGREREISEISRNLKSLAKELKVPIIALSQLNRSLESRPDKRPMLSDLRESGAIEQDADMVCFIYRDEVYNKETEDKGLAELIVAKHRAGETATVRLAWLSEYTLFANLANDTAGIPAFPPGRPDRGDITL